MIPESVMGVYRKEGGGGGVVLQVTKARYLMSVKIENNGVSVSRQCFSYKCHVSNIDFTSHRSGTLSITSNFTFSPIMP